LRCSRPRNKCKQATVATAACLIKTTAHMHTELPCSSAGERALWGLNPTLLGHNPQPLCLLRMVTGTTSSVHACRLADQSCTS
jgi:hypothetical protein